MHSAIHPVKLAYQEQLSVQEWQVYEFICRHFLASISKDAVAS